MSRSAHVCEQELCAKLCFVGQERCKLPGLPSGRKVSFEP